MTFEHDGNTYTYYPFTEIEKDIDSYLPVFVKHPDSHYIDIGCAFDIETTSYYSSKYEANRACMYHWQFALDKLVITGRTWEEFQRLIKIVNKRATKAKGDLLILVQNLSFEFSFIKGLFKWKKNKKGVYEIFAKDVRTVIFAKHKHVEFRDTLALTGMGLDKYKKNFNLDVGKLKGDLDYDLKRHSKTPLTNPELAYCINDVLVLTDFYHKFLKTQFLDQKKKIPLTSTGIVRQEVKESFKKMSKEDKKKYRNIIRNAMPSRELYLFWRTFMFRGGFTHANILACNELIEKEFASLDAKSMHPSQMLHHNFSYKYSRVNPKAFDRVVEAAKTEKYGFFGLFTFYNIKARTSHSLESKNKLVEFSRDAVFDNGRLCSASKITVMLTQIDWFNYIRMYSWKGEPEIAYLYQSYMYPLPDYLLEPLCHYFWLKENSRDDAVVYNLTKRKLNSCFGMCATGLNEIDLEFDADTQSFKPCPATKTYDELTRDLILLPQWAIEIAAYSRAQLIDAILACGKDGNGIDSIYYDTDSNKVNHPEKYLDWFEEYNNKLIEKNKKLNTYGYDKKPFEHIGCFELEYMGTRYKVLGAKRYLVEHDGEIQCTVAGMVKGTLEEYCQDKKLDIWEKFSDGLKLTEKYSKKKTTVYWDEPFEDELTDYFGNTEVIKEASCCAIIPIPFKMSMDSYFINLIKRKKKEREREVYKGVL